MLYECKNAKTLWDKLVDEFQRKEGIQIKHSIKTIIFGKQTKNPSVKFFNLLALYTKYYIYRTRLKNEKLAWNALKNFIAYKISIDLCNIKIKDNQIFYNRYQKWSET